MARTRNKLNARTVEALKDPGRYSDGGGLYLGIDNNGRSRWLYFFNVAGKRREMGLGAYPQVSLRDARKARDDAERFVQAGQDPIANRAAAKQEQGVMIPTFGKMAEEVASTRRGQWRSEKHGRQWVRSLEVYAGPIKDKSVDFHLEVTLLG